MKRWQLKEMAKDQLMGNWGEMALRTLILFLVPLGIYIFLIVFGAASSLVMAGFSGALRWPHSLNVSGYHSIPFVIMYVAAILALAVLTMVMQCGYIEGCMKLRVGRPSDMGILFSKFKMLPKLLGVMGIMILIVLPLYAVMGLMFFLEEELLSVVVAAAYIFYIYLLLRLSMVLYIVIENPYTKVWAAFKQSWFIMRGNCWRLFVLGLSFIGWYFLGAISLYIGLLWVIPYYQMTVLNFYYDLKSRHYEREPEVEFVN